ncbi:MAG: heavy metal translocating P-type ATPase metal-binding domain-containing protein [Flavobacteriaceae bacterium]|nr:heavy metal translocating P-type ATPase metal-binding domain-containing protein [Flavobacteriaceae bacterium]
MSKSCFHCGDACLTDSFQLEDKSFCCNGCQNVYLLLTENGMDDFYSFENNPGVNPSKNLDTYAYLKTAEIAESLLEFEDDQYQIVNFSVPQMHCSACIWVLEHLNKLHPGVYASSVDFPKKQLRIIYTKSSINLYEVVQLLVKLGYAPSIHFKNSEKEHVDQSYKGLLYKIGLAGFAFGNVMLLSFPEYFEDTEFWLEQFKPVFRWLMLALSVPVLLYSATDYLLSAYRSLKIKRLNLDVPISIGILALFLKSSFDVILNVGSGYFDSFTGLIFFLLLGKYVQQKTYSYLSFDRDYKSFFPVAATKIIHKEEQSVKIDHLKPGDFIRVKNNELIPCDGILQKGYTEIDYSFVTGESNLQRTYEGEKVYAGGKHFGTAIEIKVLKATQESKLIKLWRENAFAKRNLSDFENMTDRLSRYFTPAVLSIAILAAISWLFLNPEKSLFVFISVLIIACPCALALSRPFALGSMLNLLAKQQFFVKDIDVIEQMATANCLVFDKTGTLSTLDQKSIRYEGSPMDEHEQQAVYSAAAQSGHPLSKALAAEINAKNPSIPLGFEERVGHGIWANVNHMEVKLGAAAFVGNTAASCDETAIHLSTNNHYKGKYIFINRYRNGLQSIIQRLKTFHFVVLSGDKAHEKERLQNLFPAKTEYYFNQSPLQKLNRIKALQEKGFSTIMTGDGLNDAGALAQSDVGIAITEDLKNFSPASSAIMSANLFSKFPELIFSCKDAVRVVKFSFLFSILYNIIGLYFAVTGKLEPVVAAILMPLSSLTIIGFSTLMSKWVSRKYFDSKND